MIGKLSIDAMVLLENSLFNLSLLKIVTQPYLDSKREKVSQIYISSAADGYAIPNVYPMIFFFQFSYFIW